MNIFSSFEAEWAKLKGLLKDILDAFVKYMEEAEHLFHCLNKLLVQLEVCWDKLVYFELKLPSDLVGIQDMLDMFAEIQTTLFDKLQLFDRLLKTFPKLYKDLFRVPNIGGWV